MFADQMAKAISSDNDFFKNFYQGLCGELDEFMLKHQMPRVSYFPTLQGSKVVSDMSSFDDFDIS